jgi:hypothetical protein
MLKLPLVVRSKPPIEVGFEVKLPRYEFQAALFIMYEFPLTREVTSPTAKHPLLSKKTAANKHIRVGDL